MHFVLNKRDNAPRKVLIVVVLLVVEVEFIYAMCVCKVVGYFEKLLLLLASGNEDYDLKQHRDCK